MIGLHHRDDVVDGAPLERMHRRCPGMVEMAQLRLVPSQLQLAAVLEQERDPVSLHRRHFRPVAVHQPMRAQDVRLDAVDQRLTATWGNAVDVA